MEARAVCAFSLKGASHNHYTIIIILMDSIECCVYRHMMKGGANVAAL